LVRYVDLKRIKKQILGVGLDEGDARTNAALVGAVDLCHEPVHRAAARSVLGQDAPTDAAVLLVLKRVSDAWRDGDRAAGDRLLRRHVDALRRFFRNKVDSDVDDLVQRTFLECVKAKDGFEGRSSFRTFLFTVARRQLFRFYERTRRRLPEELGSVSVADLADSPSQVVAKAVEHQLLLEALRRLPLDQQTVVELHYWEQLSTSELAEVLQLPQGTVKSRLRLARSALLETLAELKPTPRPKHDDLDRWALALRERVV